MPTEEGHTRTRDKVFDVSKDMITKFANLVISRHNSGDNDTPSNDRASQPPSVTPNSNYNNGSNQWYGGGHPPSLTPGSGGQPSNSQLLMPNNDYWGPSRNPLPTPPRLPPDFGASVSSSGSYHSAPEYPVTPPPPQSSFYPNLYGSTSSAPPASSVVMLMPEPSRYQEPPPMSHANSAPPEIRRSGHRPGTQQ